MNETPDPILQFLENHLGLVEAGPFSIVRRHDGLLRYWLVYHGPLPVENGRNFPTLVKAIDWILSKGPEYTQRERI